MTINQGPPLHAEAAMASSACVTGGNVIGACGCEKAHPEHPLGPLTADEIYRSSSLIRNAWPEGTGFTFKVVTLHEPAKSRLSPYLEAERVGKLPGHIDRRSFVVYYIKNTEKLHEAVVNLTQGRVEGNVRLGPNLHPNSDGEEILLVERACLEDLRVQAEIAKLELPDDAVIVLDPWIYGSDGVDDGVYSDKKRVWQCFMYMRDAKNSTEADSCHYSLPLPISPVVDGVTHKVIRVDILPTGLDNTVKPLEPWIPRDANEYIPETNDLRTDVKPLSVIQPDGVSFTVEKFSEMGHALKWQKWEFKVGFNQREGLVIYDVHYDGKPMFYRLSLSDMAIPYADPRHPFHKKQAFDLGDAGAGLMANNLKLGCDCLGSIYYLSGVLSDPNGLPQEMPNVICIHEVDNGIGWKHTNYRTNRAVVTRDRQLVVQQILTVSNYEYITAWYFNQAADIYYEVRATGILSTQPVDLGLTKAPHPYGTIVHPGVLAGHHQHFFSLRIDPMLAGRGNEVVYDEAVAMPPDDDENPYGVGYTLTTRRIESAGGYETASHRNRVFRITNPSVLNTVNGSPVGYKIQVPPMQPILAAKGSFHYKRAQFADKSIYVTKYRDNEYYAGGKYTNQSRGVDGVRAYAGRNESLEDGDPVVWVNFGINHIPRIEEFPVMPTETMRVGLRPFNFFERNPAIDVPQSRQEVNRSVGLNGVEGLRDGVSAMTVDGSCCAQSDSGRPETLARYFTAGQVWDLGTWRYGLKAWIVEWSLSASITPLVFLIVA
ncbi:putative copper amine oxidase 1 protein [Zalerion maritima]|uniref:Amine oxidase n=1 Tax=Zalerion maritima TaxID=339359 RepID=A0AAD5WSU4_9PEZI|nr:putative copper amine oxidase 1 protein [Zalerion maritima]